MVALELRAPGFLGLAELLEIVMDQGQDSPLSKGHRSCKDRVKNGGM